MVTTCIFTLRDVMRKVQTMYGISSHGTRHTNPDDKQEIDRLLRYLQEDKVQEFCRNRDGNEEVEPVTDLMAEGAAYGDTAKAYRNFTKDGRTATNKGVPGAGDGADETGGSGERAMEVDDEAGEEESDEGPDLGEFGVMEEDLGVDDEEFSVMILDRVPSDYLHHLSLYLSLSDHHTLCPCRSLLLRLLGLLVYPCLCLYPFPLLWTLVEERHWIHGRRR